MYLWVLDQYSWLTLYSPRPGTQPEDPKFYLCISPTASWASIPPGGAAMPDAYVKVGSLYAKLSSTCTLLGEQRAKEGQMNQNREKPDP